MKASVMRRVAILSSANVAIYSTVYLKDIFYNVMRDALNLSHTQLGNVWSVYGIVAVISYPISGWLADCVSAKRLISISLVGIIILGICLSTLPSYPVLLIIFGLMGVFSILTYYSAVNKILHMVSAQQQVGRIFGLFWGLNAGFNLLIYSIGLILVRMFPTDYASVYRMMALLIAGMGILAFICLQALPLSGAKGQPASRISMEELKHLMRHPQIWLISLVIFFSYLTSCGLVYLTPYLTDVCGMEQETVLLINLIRGYLLGIIAPLILGNLADRLSSATRVIGYVSLLAGVCCVILIAVPYDSVWLAILVIVMIDVAVHGVKGQTVVTLSEAHIPYDLMGCAIGLTAVIGYSPDAFAYTWIGTMLDQWGPAGYQVLFACMAGSSLMCAIVCRRLYYLNRRRPM